MRVVVLILISLYISACGSLAVKEKDLHTQASVDLDKYMGSWYIIANIPTFMEKESVNAMESYRWDASQERIYIDYSHHHLEPQGPVTSYLQEAWIQDQHSNAEWKVRPVWPLQFNYMIFDVAADYSYSLVGVPDRSYVWIMSRNPKMSEETYHKLVSRAEELGFDTSKLRKVPQVW